MDFSCRFSRFGVGGSTDKGLMVRVSGEEGPFEEVGEMFGGEVDCKQFSTEDCPFKLWCVQAPAKKKSGRIPMAADF